MSTNYTKQKQFWVNQVPHNVVSLFLFQDLQMIGSRRCNHLLLFQINAYFINCWGQKKCKIVAILPPKEYKCTSCLWAIPKKYRPFRVNEVAQHVPVRHVSSQARPHYCTLWTKPSDALQGWKSKKRRNRRRAASPTEESCLVGQNWDHWQRLALSLLSETSPPPTACKMVPWVWPHHWRSKRHNDLFLSLICYFIMMPNSTESPRLSLVHTSTYMGEASSIWLTGSKGIFQQLIPGGRSLFTKI